MQIVSLHNLCTEQTKLYLLIAERLQVQAVTAAIMVYLNRDIWCTEISQMKYLSNQYDCCHIGAQAFTINRRKQIQDKGPT